MPHEDDQDLRGLAQDGTMDYTKWPAVLVTIIPRLEQIVYNDFPLPSIPLPGPLPSATEKEDDEEEQQKVAKRGSPDSVGDEPPDKKAKLENDDMEPGVQEASKEGEVPPAFKKSPSPNDTKSALLTPPPQTLPPLLLTLLQTIISTLRTSFPTSPPHTAQRLAELILHPKNHYRTLPSYLRALDRIVSVASPASVFPLPNIDLGNSTNGAGIMLNGTSTPSPDPSNDVDFIGGAELTEIPWLRDAQGEMTPQAHNGAPSASDLRTESTSLIDGPNGAGSVETVTVNVNGMSKSPTASSRNGGDDSPTDASSSGGQQHGITQEELLRQEQEAGVVPIPSPALVAAGGRITRSSTAASAAASRAVGIADSDEALNDTLTVETPEGEERVHARGPDVIGMEDMGPQAIGSGLEGGIDVEGALGRRGELVTPAETQFVDSASLDAISVGTGATQEMEGMDLGNGDGVGGQPEAEDKPVAEKEESPWKVTSDDEEDSMVTDADGVPEGQDAESKKQEGADRVDRTAL